MLYAGLPRIRRKDFPVAKLYSRMLLFILLPLSLVLLVCPPPMERMVEKIRGVPYITPLLEEPISSGVPRIDRRDFPEGLENIQRSLWWCAKNAEKYRQNSMKMEEVSPRDWQAFAERFLDSSEKEGRFLYTESSPIFPMEQLFFYSLHFEEDRFLAPVPFLEKGHIPLGLGGIFLCLLGSWIGKLYRSSSRGGILVARPMILLLWDAITILILSVFAYGVLDVLFVSLWNTRGWDSEFRVMGIFMTLILVPVMALFITATGAQEVFVEESGVILRGMTGFNKLEWKDFRDIRVSTLRSVKKVRNLLAPKEVTRFLLLEGEEVVLRIMEPPLKKTKRRILDALASRGSQELVSKIEVVKKDWGA
jgi:hypothetical protein